MARLFGAITKVEQLDDGTLYVEGVASSERRDDDGEIITAAAVKKAIPTYLRADGTGPLREMHQLKAAGKTTSIDVDAKGFTHIATIVVDSEAVKKVKNGVYQGFSLGGKALKRNAQDRRVIEELKLNEISLVDRGSNPDATYTLVKVSADTADEGDEVGKVLAGPRDSETVEAIRKAQKTPIQLAWF
jgi:hypothetical protein